MEYSEAIDVLFNKLPMFQRTGPAAYKANLDGTQAVCKLLNDPHKDLKYIHIAGTNGKGTVAHMIAAVLQSAGYSTGLFTSPHLDDFRERIRLNGKKIPEKTVTYFVESYNENWGSPSFFELTLGMALKFFADNKADIVVLETGMGGRLDSTNVIPTAEVCVVTNIGLDHQQFLGNDIRSIALEKAGILKNATPLVLGKMRPEAQSVLLLEALKRGCETHFGRIVPQHFAHLVNNVFSEENIATAYATTKVLRSLKWNISKEDVKEGLENFRELTGQRGRWQLVEGGNDKANVLLDCAHNLDGMTMLMHELKKLNKKLHIVFGTVGDKDPSNVLKQVPINSSLYWCSANVPRSMKVSVLESFGMKSGLMGISSNTVEEALDRAIQGASKKDIVVVCGSVFIIGEALKALNI